MDKTRTAAMKAAIAGASAAARLAPQPLPPAPTPPAAEVPNTPSKVKEPKPSKADHLDRALAERGRLPHKTRLAADYDHDALRWTGSLTMTVGGEEVTFRADASGQWKLLGKLDALYRKHLQTLAPLEGEGEGAK